MPANKNRGVTTLIDAAEEAASGVLTLKGQYDNLTLQIIGTAANTARTLTFEQSVDGVNYTAMQGVSTSLDDFPIGSGTTGKDETWVFSPSDVARVKVSLTAITGGAITVVAAFSQGG